MLATVSVIIATYRRMEELKTAVLSVLDQDYPAIEIIVIDDNGEAGWNLKVAALIDELRPCLPAGYQLALFANSRNLGAARSRNRGIHVSHGTYITFLDDDDWYLPSKVSVQVDEMRLHAADYALMNLALYNENDQLVEHKRHSALLNSCGREQLIRLHLRDHLTGTDAMMFRRDYLLDIGCFEPIDIGDEFYLMMKALEKGGKLVYVNRTLVHARVHYDGTGLSAGKLKMEGEERLFTYKTRYFHMLRRKDVRFIRMRHHAVLAFAHFRMKHYLRFGTEGCMSMVIDPIACAHMLLGRKQH